MHCLNITEDEANNIFSELLICNGSSVYSENYDESQHNITVTVTVLILLLNLTSQD